MVSGLGRRVFVEDPLRMYDGRPSSGNGRHLGQIVYREERVGFQNLHREEQQSSGLCH